MNKEERKFRSDDKGALLPEVFCPECGIKLDAAGSTEGDDGVRPNPGDLAVCINCGEIMAYTETMILRRLGVTELLDMDHEMTYSAIKARVTIRSRERIL
jgi:hypothetical protein